MKITKIALGVALGLALFSGGSFLFRWLLPPIDSVMFLKDGTECRSSEGETVFRAKLINTGLSPVKDYSVLMTLKDRSGGVVHKERMDQNVAPIGPGSTQTIYWKGEPGKWARCEYEVTRW